MYYPHQEFRLCSDHSLHTHLEQRKRDVGNSINAEKDDYVLNVNRDEYLEHLVDEMTIPVISLDEAGLTVSTKEKAIPAEAHPSSYWMSDAAAMRDVIHYHLPFNGRTDLFQFQPSHWSTGAPMVRIEDDCLVFEIINFNHTAERIKQEADRTLEEIRSAINSVNRDLDSFNKSLPALAQQSFDRRKKEILEKGDLLSALGVPIRQSTGVSSTFSVPTKRTKAIATKPKPSVSEKGFRPEPTIDSTIYNQILKIIHDVGKEFERLPSTYADKEEEHLRDHMLLILEPNFEGSATGETFNKTGKTDILLRHEGSNVFIAELKFWHGPKGFIETITQLLGYLTWRDSKAAIVMFVRNKAFMPVLESAKKAITEHENYLGFVSEQEEGFYHYRIHLNNDANREVKLAVMLFHIPT